MFSSTLFCVAPDTLHCPFANPLVQTRVALGEPHRCSSNSTNQHTHTHPFAALALARHCHCISREIRPLFLESSAQTTTPQPRARGSKSQAQAKTSPQDSSGAFGIVSDTSHSPPTPSFRLACLHLRLSRCAVTMPRR